MTDVVALPAKPPVTIIGAGVMGLSCGVLLRQAGYPVTIFSKDQPDQQASSKGGALWYPFHASPAELVGPLAAASYRTFARLAQEHPESGVSLVNLTKLGKRPVPSAYGLTSDHEFQPCTSQELPAGFPEGYTARLPFIDPNCYLPYLRRTFADRGGATFSREIPNLSALQACGSIVINCAGLGARRTADDAAVYPVRGQTVRTEKLPEPVFLLDDTDDHLPTYVFTRGDECLLGGTAESQDWDETPSDATQLSILQRCQVMEPRLKKVAILGSSVGLRPARHRLRLELCIEAGTGNLVIHNYGHGGFGFTVSWGCAEQVLFLLQRGLQIRDALPERRALD
jgi:D-amino-acid oxidase